MWYSHLHRYMHVSVFIVFFVCTVFIQLEFLAIFINNFLNKRLVFEPCQTAIWEMQWGRSEYGMNGEEAPSYCTIYVSVLLTLLSYLPRMHLRGKEYKQQTESVPTKSLDSNKSEGWTPIITHCQNKKLRSEKCTQCSQATERNAVNFA